LTRAALSGRSYLDSDDLHFARRVARDTLPAYVLKVFSDLLEVSYSRSYVTADVISTRGYTIPMQTVHNCLIQWYHSGLVSRSDQGNGYRLTHDGLEEANLAEIVLPPHVMKDKGVSP
jgi:hypothetical protein